jgi:hypothetical protein
MMALMLMMLAPAGPGAPGVLDRSDLSVINSLGPVLPGEVVASIAPNFLHHAAAGPVTVNLCSSAPSSSTAAAPAAITSGGGDGCSRLPVLQQADGIVHWKLAPPHGLLDQYNYSLCRSSSSSSSRRRGVGGSSECGAPAKLNAAELWWHQCVGWSASHKAPNVDGAANGLQCAPGAVMRIFGKGLAFNATHCSPYRPYVHHAHSSHSSSRAEAAPALQLRLTPSSGSSVVLSAVTQSCWDATFTLPRTLAPGRYRVEVRSNLPSATWETARDPDQHTLQVVGHAAAAAARCDPAGKTFVASSVASLKHALAAAAARELGATVVVKGTLVLGSADTLVVPNCTTLR